LAAPLCCTSQPVALVTVAVAGAMEPRDLLVQEKETYGSPVAWLSFFIFVTMLMALDVTCLHPPVTSGRMSFATAAKLTGFWFAMGIVFDLFLWSSLGFDAFVGFLQGFLLEYMLSFDNLFVFHLVFAYYCTPEHLLYRALYYGIAGAIVLRMVFLLIGGTLFGMDLYIVKFFFGAVLIWSGIKSANDIDEEEDNPTNNPFIAWVTKHFPVSDNYEPHGQFFVTVAEVECRPPRQSSTVSEDDLSMVDEESLAPPSEAGPTFPRLESFEGSSLLDNHAESQHRSSSRRSPLPEERQSNACRADSSEFEVTRPRGRLKRKASLLLLVVIAVWIVDLVFAVDSVASKLAVVSDLFLNCSSSAFAMLSLRSLYFVMESLVETFRMLKYGIAAILILLGLKLVFAGYIAISSPVCFALIMTICIGSMAASYWLPHFRENCDHVDPAEVRGGVAHREEQEDQLRSTAQYDQDSGAGLTSNSSTLFEEETEEPARDVNIRLAAMEEATRSTGTYSPRGLATTMASPIVVEAAE